MDQRKDLSSRTDFSFELMKNVSERLQEAVDGIPEVKSLREKARVTVAARQSLRDVVIDVKVVPTTEEDVDAQMQSARKAIGNAINDKLKETIGASIQKAIDGSRSRT